jgi:hypothetical protein
MNAEEERSRGTSAGGGVLATSLGVGLPGALAGARSALARGSIRVARLMGAGRRAAGHAGQGRRGAGRTSPSGRVPGGCAGKKGEEEERRKVGGPTRQGKGGIPPPPWRRRLGRGQQGAAATNCWAPSGL